MLHVVLGSFDVIGGGRGGDRGKRGRIVGAAEWDVIDKVRGGGQLQEGRCVVKEVTVLDSRPVG